MNVILINSRDEEYFTRIGMYVRPNDLLCPSDLKSCMHGRTQGQGSELTPLGGTYPELVF